MHPTSRALASAVKFNLTIFNIQHNLCITNSNLEQGSNKFNNSGHTKLLPKFIEQLVRYL